MLAVQQVSADNPSSVDEEVLQLQPISSFSQSGFVISKEEVSPRPDHDVDIWPTARSTRLLTFSSVARQWKVDLDCERDIAQNRYQVYSYA